MNGNQPWQWLTDLFLGETTTDTSPQPTRINQATDTTAINRSGSHMKQVVSDTHRSVTDLTERDAENRTWPITRSHTADTGAVHISELVNE